MPQTEHVKFYLVFTTNSLVMRQVKGQNQNISSTGKQIQHETVKIWESKNAEAKMLAYKGNTVTWQRKRDGQHREV